MSDKQKAKLKEIEIKAAQNSITGILNTLRNPKPPGVQVLYEGIEDPIKELHDNLMKMLEKTKQSLKDINLTPEKIEKMLSDRYLANCLEMISTIKKEAERKSIEDVDFENNYLLYAKQSNLEEYIDTFYIYMKEGKLSWGDLKITKANFTRMTDLFRARVDQHIMKRD